MILEEVARLIKISREGVRQLEQNALRKLRKSDPLRIHAGVPLLVVEQKKKR